MGLGGAVAVVIVAFFLAGAGLKLLSWSRRRAALRGIEPQQIVKQVRGVSMRVLVQGGAALPGMSRSKANRTTGDLVLLADRFVITSGRGVIADLRADRGRKFRSVRSTGPGRLVIEGDVPAPSGSPGLFRVELHLDDAAAWVAALKPWESGDKAEFGTL